MWQPEKWAEAIEKLEEIKDSNEGFEAFFKEFRIAFEYRVSGEYNRIGGYKWNEEKINSAIQHLDASVDRQTWIAYCRAIADACVVAGMDEMGMFALVKEWSKQAENWKDDADLVGVFQPTGTYKGPHAASAPLVAAAKDVGWEPPLNIIANASDEQLEESLEWLELEFRIEFRGGQERVRYIGSEDKSGDVRQQWLEWNTLSTVNVCNIKGLLNRNFHVLKGDDTKPLQIGRQTLRDILHDLCGQNQQDSFREFLEGLPEWDKVERIDHILHKHFGAADDAMSQWASRYPFIGAVERCYEPGKLHRVIPILKGNQDIGKSALYRHTLPPALQMGGFSDQLKLDDSPQRQIEHYHRPSLSKCPNWLGCGRLILKLSNRS